MVNDPILIEQIKALRAEGQSFAYISRVLKMGRDRVQWVCDENDWRARYYMGLRRKRRSAIERARRPNATNINISFDSTFTTVHIPKKEKPPNKDRQAAVLELAAQFARDVIDRDRFQALLREQYGARV